MPSYRVVFTVKVHQIGRWQDPTPTWIAVVVRDAKDQDDAVMIVQKKLDRLVNGDEL